ncbi:hypothetical protein MNV49_005432 [Pseudohyphozyma bogoriensis]|nr:hypothetical protein MNV49_005432 [Pseudohyphozyma bogoriensis]
MRASTEKAQETERLVANSLHAQAPGAAGSSSELAPLALPPLGSIQVYRNGYHVFAIRKDDVIVPVGVVKFNQRFNFSPQDQIDYDRIFEDVPEMARVMREVTSNAAHKGWMGAGGTRPGQDGGKSFGVYAADDDAFDSAEDLELHHFRIQRVGATFSRRFQKLLPYAFDINAVKGVNTPSLLGYPLWKGKKRNDGGVFSNLTVFAKDTKGRYMQNRLHHDNDEGDYVYSITFHREVTPAGDIKHISNTSHLRASTSDGSVNTLRYRSLESELARFPSGLETDEERKRWELEKEGLKKERDLSWAKEREKIGLVYREGVVGEGDQDAHEAPVREMTEQMERFVVD